jgi:DNA-binding winged helix-turn-helix (wHTH) protein/tetratricopeptide (TPR) repeat protein
MTEGVSFQFAGHVLDLRRGNLSRDGRDIELRPKSFALLHYMVEHAGRLVSRDELFQALWPDVFVTDNSLTRCVMEVRRALADDAESILKTVPKRGYILAAPISVPSPKAAATSRTRSEEPDRGSVAVPMAPAAKPTPSAETTTLPSEIKFVTLLRAGLVDTPLLVAGLGPEAALARLRQPVEAMAMAVRQCHGIVLKELDDGVLAAFGAPLAAEHHAVLAGRAALTLVDRIRHLDDAVLGVRVGLHSGSVMGGIATVEGAPGYRLGGAPVLTVEAIQSLAPPNTILACAECRRLAEGYLRFDGATPLSPGISTGHAPVYGVTGLGDGGSWRVRSKRVAVRFVGRAGEMATLTRAAEAVTAGYGQALLIIGEPGIGKSRLVHEFVAALAPAAWCLIDIACDPFAADSPYGAVKTLLAQCLAALVPEFEDLSAAIESPAIGLPPLWRSALRALLDLGIIDPAWVALEARQRGRAITDAVCAVSEAAFRARPTLLLVEDVHWLAVASAPIVARIVGLAAGHRVLILLTSRPDPKTEWCDGHKLTRIPLAPFDAIDGAVVLETSLGAQSRLAAVKRRVLAQTGGVPLFIEEVCRDLLDRHGPAHQWSSGTLAALRRDMGVPSTIQGVIAQRIDRLGAADRATLQVAAVIGPIVAVELLHGVAARPEDELADSLARLDAAGLLLEKTLLPQHKYEFAHDLIRLVAYNSLPEAARLRRHREILAVLEMETAASEARSALLCRHAVGSAQWARARDYAVSIARTCLERSAFADAAQYFETAIDAVDRLPECLERERAAIDLRIETRLAYYSSGRLDRQTDLSTEAELRAVAIGDEARIIAAMAVSANMVALTRSPVAAIARCPEILKRAECLGDVSLITSVEFTLANALLTAGRYREAEIQAGRAWWQLNGPNPQAPLTAAVSMERLFCCLVKTHAHVELGEVAQADFFRREATAIGGESPSSFERVTAGLCQGFYELMCGDAATAVTDLTRTLDLAVHEDMPIQRCVAGLYLGIAQLQQGSIEQAGETLAQVRDESGEIGYAVMNLRAALHLGRAMARRGERRAAIDAIARVYDVAQLQGFQGDEAAALFAMGEVLAGGPKRDLRCAIEYLDRSINIAAMLGAQRQISDSLALRERLGQAAEAVGAKSKLSRSANNRGCRADLAPHGKSSAEADLSASGR